ncbi:helix-turn-helix transcriptional regulator [bacterium]|nr:helix-turn-helix transcriptional regulator [bacterium]
MEKSSDKLDIAKLYRIIWDIFIYGHYYKDIEKLDLEELPKLIGLTRIPNCVFCISIDDYSHMSIQEQLQTKELIERIITQIMNDREYFLLFAHQNCFYLNAYILELEAQEEDSKRCLQRLAEDIKIVPREFDISITIGIDFYKYQQTSIWKWKEIAQHAIVANRRKFFEGKDKIYFYENSNHFNRSYSNVSSKSYSELWHRLLNYIVAGDINKAKKTALFLTEDVFRYNLDRLFYLRIKLIETGTLIICDMIELGFSESKLSQVLTEFIEKVNSFYDIIDLAETFYLLVDHLVDFAIKQKYKLNPIVMKAKEIISSSEDLSDLTLTKVSKLVNVNYSYLSRLFKKELGMSFTEYVNKERIKRALPLLFEKHRRIQDIAICSGFKDVQQFERVFRRFYHMTPLQYKKVNV